MTRTAIRKAVSSPPVIANFDEQLDEVVMAGRIFLSNEDESEDVVIRMSSDEAKALYDLLSKLSFSAMMDRGLSSGECILINNILHSTY